MNISSVYNNRSSVKAKKMKNCYYKAKSQRKARNNKKESFYLLCAVFLAGHQKIL